MKLFLTSIAVMLALCKADEADRELRKQPHQSGEGGGRLGGRLEAMIETECSDPATYCAEVVVEELGCTFEPLVRPDISNLDEEAKAAAKEDFKAEVDERRQDMVKCACCTSMSVEDILASARPLEGSGGRPGGMAGREGSESELASSMSSGDDGSTSSGDVGLSARTASRPLGGRGGSGGRPGGMDSDGGGFRPQSGEGGTDIEARLEEKCNEDGVDEKCTEMASQAQAMDCTKFDSMMSNLDDSMIDMNTRGGRRKTFFYCGCCRGSGGD